MRIQKAFQVNVPANRGWPYFMEPEKIYWGVTSKIFEYTSSQHNGAGTPIYLEEQAGGPLMKMKFEISEWK